MWPLRPFVSSRLRLWERTSRPSYRLLLVDEVLKIISLDKIFNVFQLITQKKIKDPNISVTLTELLEIAVSQSCSEWRRQLREKSLILNLVQNSSLSCIQKHIFAVTLIARVNDALEESIFFHALWNFCRLIISSSENLFLKTHVKLLLLDIFVKSFKEFR